jgi:flagellar hook-associated protein 1 FlgK
VPATEILFGKLEIKFDIDPKAGDLFTFSKNVDAFGDNRNLRMLSATENEEIYNGFSARTYYSNMVNKVGSVVDLAKLNKDAADILYDENRVKKSSLSGVNLDQEAAELMRYQQAFQASAQLIQVSTKLFDAIISAS